MADNISTLSDATFDEQIGVAAEPVIVDFWAEWCGPCKMIAPILEEIADEQAGKLQVAKLNVDDNPDTARRFDVMSIPTMIVFKDGEEAPSSGPRARASSSRICAPSCRSPERAVPARRRPTDSPQHPTRPPRRHGGGGLVAFRQRSSDRRSTASRRPRSGPRGRGRGLVRSTRHSLPTKG